MNLKFNFAIFSVLTLLTAVQPVEARNKSANTCVTVGSDCYQETYTVPVGSSSPMDILFVVDTSDSMTDELGRIKTGISQLMNSLPVGADINVGVMLAHGSLSTQSGAMFKATGEPAVLKSKMLTSSQMNTFMNHKLSSLPQDANAGGGEEGMFSLFNGITTPGLLAASQADGMFRAEASLTVIFVADQRDICAITPAGVPAETDPAKLAARIRDCEGLTAQGLTSRLKTLKGAQSLAVSGIIHAQAPAPSADGDEIGYGYTDMISLSKGTAIDLDKSQIGASLQKLVLGEGSSANAAFTLTHDGVDPSSVKVTVNGMEVPFVLSGQTVTIQQNIPAGATVVINYCVNKSDLSGKAKKLAAIMTMACPIYNKSYPQPYVAPTAAEIWTHLTSCTPERYPETPTTTAQQKTLDQLLNTQDPSLRVKMFKRLWYTPEFSDHFEFYFGLEIKEAVQLFCLNNPYLPEMLVTSEYAKVLYDHLDSWKANPAAQKRWNFVQGIRKQIRSCVNQ
ncbi:MAG: hypothetical protein JSU04_11660 [Bdellovibrionales bacterium]|nr:hypothetical protein [Bdellovibrionales bacterium]